jgi:hypothetical protein
LSFGGLRSSTRRRIRASNTGGGNSNIGIPERIRIPTIRFPPKINTRDLRLDAALLPLGCVAIRHTSFGSQARDSVAVHPRLDYAIGPQVIFKYIPIVLLAPVVHISLKSALDLGITSYMTTPCLAIDLGNSIMPALENRAAPSLADSTKSFGILLAEDNVVNQRLAVKILEKQHYVVAVVGNG